MIFLANEFEIFGIKFWGVCKENARREVFEQTQSYVEGKRQELINFITNGLVLIKILKLSIESTIRMSFANFDENKIQDTQLYDFLKQIKQK